VTPSVASQISVDGYWRQSESVDWLKIDSGQHLVSFSDIIDYDTPPCTHVEVMTGQTTEFEARFAP